MSCNPSPAVKPLCAKVAYDFEPGSTLHLTVANYGRVEGVVYRKPLSKSKNTLELVGCKVLNPQVGDGYLGVQRFVDQEILDVKIVKGPPKPKIRSCAVEKVCHTVVIDNMPAFLKFVTFLEKNVTKVGLNFHGTFVGRDGEVGWIALFYDNTLFMLDTISLVEREPQFWEKLREPLFENQEILKIIHNGRPIADYLYHRHAIRIQKVFDIQVAEYYIWTRYQAPEKVLNTKNNYKRLSYCLEVFLLSEVFGGELLMLKEFEQMSFCNASPLMERPVTDKNCCKCVAIDVKYLCKLHEVLAKEMNKEYENLVSCHLLHLVEGNAGVMERVLGCPDEIPAQVVKSRAAPRGKFVEMKVIQKVVPDKENGEIVNGVDGLFI